MALLFSSPASYITSYGKAPADYHYSVAAQRPACRGRPDCRVLTSGLYRLTELAHPNRASAVRAACRRGDRVRRRCAARPGRARLDDPVLAAGTVAGHRPRPGRISAPVRRAVQLQRRARQAAAPADLARLRAEPGLLRACIQRRSAAARRDRRRPAGAVRRRAAVLALRALLRD